MVTHTNISAVDDNTGILLIIEEEFANDTDYKFKFYSDGNQFLNDIQEISAAKAKARHILESTDIKLDVSDLNLTTEPDVDLVILDVHMPDFDVVEAVKTIDGVCPMAYIIIISAVRDFDTLKDLSNMGIFRFCEKDETNFLINLREYIKAAHWKITQRKGLFLGKLKNGN